MRQRLPIIILALIPSVIFLQSLFFKFAGAPETQQIFGLLDVWASRDLGLPGLFTGILGGTTIGLVELVASTLILAGVFLKKPLMTFIGAMVGLGTISGAIFFHSFTDLHIGIPVTPACPIVNSNVTIGGDPVPIPLTSYDAIIAVPGCDGVYDLFVMACVTWLCCAALVYLHRSAFNSLIKR